MGDYFGIMGKAAPQDAVQEEEGTDEKTERKIGENGVQIEVICLCADCRFMDGDGKCRFRKIMIYPTGRCAFYETTRDDDTSDEV